IGTFGFLPFSIQDVVAGAGQNMDQVESRTTSFDVARIRMHYAEYNWTIDRFLAEAKNREWFNSQLFRPSTDPRYTFHLRLYPNGIDEASKDYVSLYLHNSTVDIDQVIVQYRFAIFDQSGQKNNLGA